MAPTSIGDLFTHITALMTRDSAFFQSAGETLYRDFAICLFAWFGIQWALTGGMAMERLVELILRVSIGFAMVHFYSTALPGFGGRSFHNLITDEGQYLANQLNNGLITRLFNSLDAFWAGWPTPSIFAIFSLETVEYVIVFLTICLAEVGVYVVIAFGYIAQACAVLVGPIFISFYIFPSMEFIFWGWLKAILQYSFYPVIANAYLYVFGSLLVNYIRDHAPPYDGPNAFALVMPMLVMLVAFTFGILKIPQLVNSLFAGKSGESALPSFLGGS